MQPQDRNLFFHKAQPEVAAICGHLACRLISQIVISNPQLIVFQWAGYFLSSSTTSTRSATMVTTET